MARHRMHKAKFGRCNYCLVEMNDIPNHDWERTRDHILPKSEGGRRTIDCCRWCNTLKSNMPFDLFMRILGLSTIDGVLNRDVVDRLGRAWQRVEGQAKKRREEMERKEIEDVAANREWMTWDGKEDPHDEVLGPPVEGTLAAALRKGAYRHWEEAYSQALEYSRETAASIETKLKGNDNGPTSPTEIKA